MSHTIEEKYRGLDVHVDGRRTHVRVWGDGDPVLVCLHGWGGSVGSFNALAPRLAQALGGAVWCVDVPGFGQSDPPPADGWGTRQFADWLEGTLAELGLRDVPRLGHSNGGRILLRHSLTHPHHVPTVLVGASGVQWPLTRRQRLTQVLAKVSKPLTERLPKRLVRWVTAKVFRAHDWAAAPASMKATLSKKMAEKCMRTELGGVTQRVLLLWGEHDTMTPMKSARVLHEGLPNAELAVCGGRHGIHRTHAEWVTERVGGFLGRDDRA